MAKVEQDLSRSHIAFQLKDGDIDQFHVMRYRGTEGLCQLFRFEIELISDDDQAMSDDLVGKPAFLRLGQTEEDATWFHGLLSRFELIGHGPHKTHYRAELVPAIWLLTQRVNSRSFQNMKVSEIVSKVITDANLEGYYPLSLQIEATTAQREYTCQYRESDYNFICRLMEAEGVRWYFKHSQADCKFVTAASATYEDGPALPYNPPSGMNISDQTDHVFRFRMSQSVRPGSVVLDDFDFKNPELSLNSTADAERDAGLQFYDYPGGFETQGDGGTIAGLRKDEFETGRIMAIGQSNCRNLHPGLKMTLSDYPFPDRLSERANIPYLLTSVTHQGKQATSQSSMGSGIDARMTANDQTANRASTGWLYHGGQVVRDVCTAAVVQGGNALEALSIPNLIDDVVGDVMSVESPIYECRFECIPADVQYRPPRITPWPIMRGSQTAVVVGEGEIDTDEYGRVMVQFVWDRQNQSSCRIRVASGWAGGGYGMMFIPRVGQEVIVDYLEGNVDRPIITGRVWNQNNMPAYELPGEKTKSYIKTNSSMGGGGTNEIRFEDLKDSEQMLINAQKDFHIRVGKNEGEERHNVKDNRNLTVGGEQRTQIGGARSTDVGGKDAIHVGDTRSVVVEADVHYDYKANHGHKVASEYFLSTNKAIIEAPGGISLKCGGNFVVINQMGVTIKGSMVLINSGGAAIPGTASLTPVSPAAPEPADEVEPGEDKSYGRDPSEMPPIEEEPYQGQWVSIDLKDKEGKPQAGEFYRITTPTGKVLEGTLDVNGFKRVWVDEEGDCQISFPSLSSEEWDRA